MNYFKICFFEVRFEEFPPMEHSTFCNQSCHLCRTRHIVIYRICFVVLLSCLYMLYKLVDLTGSKLPHSLVSKLETCLSQVETKSNSIAILEPFLFQHIQDIYVFHKAYQILLIWLSNHHNQPILVILQGLQCTVRQYIQLVIFRLEILQIWVHVEQESLPDQII